MRLHKYAFVTDDAKISFIFHHKLAGNYANKVDNKNTKLIKLDALRVNIKDAKKNSLATLKISENLFFY